MPQRNEGQNGGGNTSGSESSQTHSRGSVAMTQEQRIAQLKRSLEASRNGCVCCDTAEHLKFSDCCGNAVCRACMRSFLASQRKCSVCRTPLRHVEWIHMEGGFVVHRKFTNALQHTADEEEKAAPDNRVNRWVRNSLERQRPDFREEDATSQEVLGEEDATWVGQMVRSAQGRFFDT